MFMVWWDGEFKRKMENVGLRLWLYKHYVDDIDSIMSVPKAGLRFDGNDLVEDELMAEIDQGREPRESNAFISIHCKQHPLVHSNGD
jgi:hypothetical protein